MTDPNTKKAEAEKAPSQTAGLQAKGYKVRLYPTKVQEQKLLQTLGACRFVWNHFLNKRNEAYRNGITRAKNKLIVCEDLAVKNMQKNHCLAGSIADTGWGEFIRQLQYKQEWRGGQFRVVDRFFPSSKTCSGCDHVLDSLPLNVRQWTCPKCNAVHDRDVNAARNILKEGLRNSRSVESKVGSTKRKVASQHSDNPS